jgi:hypothetical protein
MKSFEDLQDLGANVIHEQTHIARAKLESLLSKSYGDLTRVQFMGFMSILEREYGIDLADIREEYDAFVQTHPDVTIPKTSVILQAESRSRQKWILGGVVAIAFLVTMGSMVQGRLSIAPSDEIMKLSSANIEVADVNEAIITASELNTTGMDVNTTPVNQNESNVSLKPAIPLKNDVNATAKTVSTIENAISIKPTVKVWMGILDLTTGAKTQKTTKDPIVLDSSKNTLYMFGHGRLTIVTPEGTKTLQDRSTVWFMYESGKLKQINATEFRERNNGANW